MRITNANLTRVDVRYKYTLDLLLVLSQHRRLKEIMNKDKFALVSIAPNVLAYNCYSYTFS